VASDNGAWLIGSAESGYELVQHFTKQNSPLFSDRVLSVEVEDQSGRVFFATDRGLLSWQGDAIAPVAKVQDLEIFPNPFVVADGPGSVTIAGLVEETDVRIMSPAGVLVASFRARGGRALWDGRDQSGLPVPSGMYIVAAVGTEGEGAAYGRLAIVR
jgi:hypothetical protein